MGSCHNVHALSRSPVLAAGSTDSAAFPSALRSCHCLLESLDPG